MDVHYVYASCAASDLGIGDTVMDRGREHGQVAYVHTETQHRIKTLVIGFGQPAHVTPDGSVVEAVTDHSVKWSPNRSVKRMEARFAVA